MSGSAGRVGVFVAVRPGSDGPGRVSATTARSVRCCSRSCVWPCSLPTLGSDALTASSSRAASSSCPRLSANSARSSPADTTCAALIDRARFAKNTSEIAQAGSPGMRGAPAGGGPAEPQRDDDDGDRGAAQGMPRRERLPRRPSTPAQPASAGKQAGHGRRGQGTTSGRRSGGRGAGDEAYRTSRVAGVGAGARAGARAESSRRQQPDGGQIQIREVGGVVGVGVAGTRFARVCGPCTDGRRPPCGQRVRGTRGCGASGLADRRLGHRPQERSVGRLLVDAGGPVRDR